MRRWSQEEATRTIDEVKRRAVIDLEFRKLALSNANAAIARVNPKPLPADVSVEFRDHSDGDDTKSESDKKFIIVLPEPIVDTGELSDVELEQAAGGLTLIRFPEE